MESSEINDYINIDEALVRVRGNAPLYAKLLKMYLTSDQFEKFSSNIEKKNYAEAELNIHSIKGITSNLSLNRLYELSKKLNEQLKSGSAFDDDLSEYFIVADKTRAAVIQYLGGNS